MSGVVCLAITLFASPCELPRPVAPEPQVFLYQSVAHEDGRDVRAAMYIVPSMPRIGPVPYSPDRAYVPDTVKPADALPQGVRREPHKGAPARTAPKVPPDADAPVKRPVSIGTLRVPDGTTRYLDERDGGIVVYAGTRSSLIKRGATRVLHDPAREKAKGSGYKAVDEAARKHGLDRDLAYRMARQESGGTCRITSRANARGPMQVIPSTGAIHGYTGKELYDCRKGADAGVREMKRLLKITNGDVRKALIGYNCGEGCINRKRLPKETRDYIRIIGGYKK